MSAERNEFKNTNLSNGINIMHIIIIDRLLCLTSMNFLGSQLI